MSCVQRVLIARKVRLIQYHVMLVATVAQGRHNVLVVPLATFANKVQLFLLHVFLELIVQLDKALAKHVQLDHIVLRNKSHQLSVDLANTVWLVQVNVKLVPQEIHVL